MRTLFSTFLWILILSSAVNAQELNATVKINTQKLQTADPKVFETLEQTLREFLNSQKWTDDVFEKSELVNCNFILTIQEERSATSFKAELAIQSSRPIFGSDQETPMFNYLDKDVTFEYEQFQPLVYTKNVYNDNLSSILSFYVYVILGLDYDSFAPLGGEKYLQTAQEILNAVPSSATSVNPGWRSSEANRNRYWIIENLLSPRMRPMRQGIYDYHRKGLDMMSENSDEGRTTIVLALDQLEKVNQSYPNSMLVQLFSNTKSQEIVEIFKRGTIPEQDRVIQIMTKVDPTGSNKYRSIK